MLTREGCILLTFVFCRDLRHLPVLSIDPIGCMDIDDALHAKRLENGNIEVSYRIMNDALGSSSSGCCTFSSSLLFLPTNIFKMLKCRLEYTLQM